MTSTKYLASGALAYIDDKGRVTSIARKADLDAEEWGEGPTCSLCDGLGHGYPGGGPCPLEIRGREDAEEDLRRYGSY